MHDQRTLAWWSVRAAIIAGIASVALSLLMVLRVTSTLGVCFGCDRVEILGLPSEVAAAVTALVIAVGGLVWILRIHRGPNDESPPWRYRDR